MDQVVRQLEVPDDRRTLDERPHRLLDGRSARGIQRSALRRLQRRLLPHGDDALGLDPDFLRRERVARGNQKAGQERQPAQKRPPLRHHPPEPLRSSWNVR